VPERPREPAAQPNERDPVERDPGERAADHAGIDRLAAELLPALIAKLGTTNLGELEVREGAWQVRLRRPLASGVNYGRRSSDRPSRSHPGHEGHGHAPGAVELAAVGPGRPSERGEVSARDDGPPRVFATSPAVGVFAPAADLAVGRRVRAGERLGAVDVLGVAQEVTAPFDGILGPVLVDAGTAVEYGQELMRIEPLLTDPA
jgi:biotin carboxyl carrier protein